MEETILIGNYFFTCHATKFYYSESHNIGIPTKYIMYNKIVHKTSYRGAVVYEFDSRQWHKICHRELGPYFNQTPYFCSNFWPLQDSQIHP